MFWVLPTPQLGSPFSQYYRLKSKSWFWWTLLFSFFFFFFWIRWLLSDLWRFFANAQSLSFPPVISSKAILLYTLHWNLRSRFISNSGYFRLSGMRRRQVYLHNQAHTHTHTQHCVLKGFPFSTVAKKQGFVLFLKTSKQKWDFFFKSNAFSGVAELIIWNPISCWFSEIHFFSFLNYQVIFASLRWPPPLIMVFLVDSWILHPKIFSRILDSLFTRDINLLFYLFMMPSSTFISGWILGSVFISLIF